jgi:hypothetical protein
MLSLAPASEKIQREKEDVVGGGDDETPGSRAARSGSRAGDLWHEPAA